MQSKRNRKFLFFFYMKKQNISVESILLNGEGIHIMICYEIYAGHSVSILMKTGEKEMVISIKEKGAMGDGETINTEIIQGCIDLCYASGDRKSVV